MWPVYLEQKATHFCSRWAFQSRCPSRISTSWPVLFLIYDMSSVICTDKLIQYPDGTTFKDTSLQVLEHKAFLQVNATGQFLSENNLSINSNKTKYICFNLKQRSNQAPIV